MKECYLNPKSLPQDTLKLLNKAGIQKSDITGRFCPQSSALLVLDLQKFFFDPASHAYIPSVSAIIPSLLTLIDSFHQNRRPVFCTRHLNTDKNAGMMKSWWKDLITDNNPLSRLIPEIENHRLPVIEKSQYDAFHHTNLEQKLHDADVSQLVITGVMTHLCCETTARSGFMRGFKIFFPLDGTATYNAAFHSASLLNLAHGFAHITDIVDIKSAMPND